MSVYTVTGGFVGRLRVVARRVLVDPLRVLVRSGSPPSSLALVVATLLGAWVIAFESGSPVSVSRHWFYVPVLIAGLRLGLIAALATAVVAAFLAGPLVPLPDVGFGFDEHGPWLQRGVFLVFVALLTGAAVEALRERERVDADVARREEQLAAHHHELAIQRAALIQTISHELRTPLTILKGTAELLRGLEDQIRPASAAQLIGPLGRATHRLESLVSMVLEVGDASHPDELVAVPVAVDELLDQAVHRAADAVTRERIERIIEGDLTEVTTVPDYVVVALGCLLDNALRFSPDDEAVQLVARPVGAGIVEFLVRDHGPGFDPRLVDHLFQPFTQADASTTRRHDGLGVGLFTTRKLVGRLGGEVILEPRPGGGSVARLRLPDGATQPSV
ncbi:MAG: HAMP domain-containing histidine kinase [Actinobacteria bacterium]|nr:HAMP domain-containing histidine kinase [Actinomycetota bacterium]